jgi:WD40 repeat protein
MIAGSATQEGGGKGIAVWETRTGKQKQSVRIETQVDCVGVSDDGRTVCAHVPGRGDKGKILLFDTAAGKIQAELSTFPIWREQVSFQRLYPSPDGRTLVAIGTFRRANGPPPMPSSSHDNWNVLVWDVKSGKPLAVLPGGQALAYSPDGRILAYANDTTVTVYDLIRGTLSRASPRHSAKVTGLAFSPDGRTLASSSDDATILVWDLPGQFGKAQQK